jgi:hypothetical protein
MGYYTQFSEEISIDPPIPYALVKDTKFVANSYAWGYVNEDVTFKVVEDTAGMRYATAIIPSQEEEYRGYHIVEAVQEILDMFSRNHTFSGYINAEGENTGDLWRLCIVNGRAVEIKPEIVWPEEAR